MKKVRSAHSVFLPADKCEFEPTSYGKKGPGEGLAPRKRETPEVRAVSYSNRALESHELQQTNPYCPAVTQSVLSSSIFSLNNQKWLRLELDFWHILCYLFQDH